MVLYKIVLITSYQGKSYQAHCKRWAFLLSSVFMLQNYEKLIDELMLFDYSNLSKLPELFEGLSIYDVVAASEVFTLDEAIDHSQVAKAKFVLESILNNTCDFSKVIPLDIKTLYAANDYYAAIKASQA